MDAPSYVQGQYTVAQRDAIFTTAAKYPDASDGLPNQVPMIFPDGTVNWRQLSAGGETGTANANIAVVESTQYASKDYESGDLLVYNGQLYKTVAFIPSGTVITPGANVTPTRVDLSFLSARGKGKNLGFNWFWVGGGSQAGNGAFPINQRGVTTYTGAGKIFDGWEQTGGTTQLYSAYIAHDAPANESSSLIQEIDSAIASNSSADVRQLYRDTYTFSALIFTANGYDNGYDIVHGSLWLNSQESIFYQNSDFALIAKTTPGKIQLKIQVYAGCSVLLGGIKFEQGPISTFAAKYQDTVILFDPPPDYGEELAKCQRYLLPITAGTIMKGLSIGGTYYVDVETPVTMAGSPKLTADLSIVALDGSAHVLTIPANSVGATQPAAVQLTVSAPTLTSLTSVLSQVQNSTFLSAEP